MQDKLQLFSMFFLLSQSKLFNRNPPNCEFLWSWSHKFSHVDKLTATPLKMAIGLLFACKLSQQFSPMWPYFYAYFTVDAEVVWTIHSFIKITTTFLLFLLLSLLKHTRFSKQPFSFQGKQLIRLLFFVCDVEFLHLNLFSFILSEASGGPGVLEPLPF